MAKYSLECMETGCRHKETGLEVKPGWDEGEVPCPDCGKPMQRMFDAIFAQAWRKMSTSDKIAMRDGYY